VVAGAQHAAATVLATIARAPIRAAARPRAKLSLTEIIIISKVLVLSV
jgi:hypothetical protein